jgi:hypothetical protein
LWSFRPYPGDPRPHLGRDSTRVNASSARAGMFQLGKESPDRSSFGDCFGSKISRAPAERMA